MADKDNTDVNHISTPKVKSEFSNPNDLKDLLGDIDHIDLAKNLAIMDETLHLKTEKYTQEPELPKTFKDTTDDKELPAHNIRENIGEEMAPDVKKDVKKTHDEAPATALTNLTAAFKTLDELI